MRVDFIRQPKNERVMRSNLEATLVGKTESQRFYKLNQKIYKGINRLTGKEVDISADIVDTLNRIKPEFIDKIEVDGSTIICVSDAHTHLERLVFTAFEQNPGEFARTTVQIEGCHTFMIHGGDARSIKPDYVYIKNLAVINDLSFHYKSLI